MGIVAFLHQQGVKHPRSRTPTMPCKPNKTTRRERGSDHFDLTSKRAQEPRHKAYANLNRSSRGNQRKKNQVDRSYGREDTIETVLGAVLMEIRFLSCESVLLGC